MKLIIDTRCGIAGDIVNAGLIGLGACEKQMIYAMEYAGNHTGKTKIKSIYSDNISGLDIKIENDYDNLHESEIKKFLIKIIDDLNINKHYRNTPKKILEALCESERHAHNHYETDSSNSEAVLHEAKDILIDIIGLTSGMQELNITEIFYTEYINVGNGIINFSHGEFEVPAPATRFLLNKHKIKWKKSNISEEMTTPTGASILAGCNAKCVNITDLENSHIIKKALARGTKNTPPISFYLAE